MKGFNLLAHSFLHYKRYQESLEFFKRLRDTAKMGHDLETSMYALK